MQIFSTDCQFQQLPIMYAEVVLKGKYEKKFGTSHLNFYAVNQSIMHKLCMRLVPQLERLFTNFSLPKVRRLYLALTAVQTASVTSFSHTA